MSKLTPPARLPYRAVGQRLYDADNRLVGRVRNARTAALIVRAVKDLDAVPRASSAIYKAEEKN